MSVIVRAPQRLLAGLLAAVLAVAGLTTAATTASAAAMHRLAGDNRYETAEAIAGPTFPDGVTDVILATGANYPDALAAAGIAGHVGGPVLLTDSDRLSPATVAALGALTPTTVHIAGGTAAVSRDVENELHAAGYATTRFAGGDRYETAALIARAVGKAGIAGNTAIIATGTDFPDALAGGPLAYAGPYPILLVTGDGVPQATADALTELGITDLIILGETAAVSDEIETELERLTGDADVTRLGGASRYETAAKVAQFGVDTAGFDLSTVLLANGVANRGVDALAGAPHGGVISAPILLVTEDTVPAGTAAFLTDHAPAIATVRALGGPAVIYDATLTAAATAATAAPTSNATLRVLPTDAVTRDLVSGVETAADGDARDYTVNGLASDEMYTIALLPADAVTDDAGVVSFVDIDDDGHADETGSVSAEIVSVQHVTGTDYDQVATAVPVSGEIVFRVDGAVAEDVVPVVFADADGDGALDLAADGTPIAAEPFGVGGVVRYLVPEAADGTDAPTEMPTTVDEDGDVFGDADSTYHYDANDRFRLGGQQITMAEFDLILSVGDTVAVTGYQRDDALVSTFDITDDVAAAPTGLSVTVSDADSDGAVDDAAFDWTASVDGRIATYTVAIDEGCDESGTYDDTTTVTAGNETHVTVSNLADGTHCAAVRGTTTVGANESEWSRHVSLTIDAVDEPTIVSATLTTDAELRGAVGHTDVWQVLFSKSIDGSDTLKWVFQLTDRDGDAFDVACVPSPAEVNSRDSLTDAGCSLGDGSDDSVTGDSLTLTIWDDPVDLNIGGGDDGIQYPVTITATNDAVDDLETGTPVDVPGSADTQID